MSLESMAKEVLGPEGSAQVPVGPTLEEAEVAVRRGNEELSRLSTARREELPRGWWKGLDQLLI